MGPELHRQGPILDIKLIRSLNGLRRIAMGTRFGASSQVAEQSRRALTLKLDHPSGAGQRGRCRRCEGAGEADWRLAIDQIDCTASCGCAMTLVRHAYAGKPRRNERR